MISKEIIYRIIYRQKEYVNHPRRTVQRTILQEILPWMKDKRILVLSGIRRCGKSTLLFELMKKTEGWCYVNFEDEGFVNFNAEEFEILNEALVDVYGACKIFYFDEIQNIDRFELFVRRLQEEGKKVVLTGSNAALLSAELGTRLTGRYKQFEVFPFSFSEYLRFYEIDVLQKDLYRVESKLKILHKFKQYFSDGGFPEYLENNDSDYLRTMYENILYRDIIARYGIRRIKTLKEMIQLLASNISSLITYNSMKNSLQLSNAITAKEYISHLQNAYLFFEVLSFSYSVKKQLNLPRKIYLIDPSLQHIGITMSPDKGKILENIIYLDLRRKHKEAYYFKENRECDFLIRDGKKISEAIQVCYEINDQNREREEEGLLEAMHAHSLKQGMIITYDQEYVVKKGSKKIDIIPAWKILL